MPARWSVRMRRWRTAIKVKQSMPWLHRGDTRYFYRMRRLNGRMTAEYLGRGRAAHQAAAEIEERRRRRHQQAQAVVDHEARYSDGLEALNELCQASDLLAKATLVANGYYQHARGAWRRRPNVPDLETPDRDGLPGQA